MTEFQARRYFSRRMLPIATLVGIFVILSMPLLYWILETDRISQVSMVLAQGLAERLRGLIISNPGSWEGDAQKLLAAIEPQMLNQEIERVVIIDRGGKALMDLDNPQALRAFFLNSLRTAHPLILDGRRYGSIILYSSLRSVEVNSTKMLAILTILGVALGLSIYLFPVRVVEQMERRIGGLTSELNRRYQDALHESLIDGLTGIFNHRTFQRYLEEEIQKAGRTRRPLSLLMIDLDRFKTFNDLHGHDYGDLVLNELANILKRERRTSDIVARYGGEEFALILPETGLEGAKRVAEDIRRQVAEHGFLTPSGRTSPLTVSIGIAVYPDDGFSKDDILRKADTALYYAKARGRNAVETYQGVKKEVPTLDLEELKRQELSVTAVHSLAAAVDARDPYTREHSIRVTSFAERLGKAAGLTSNELRAIRVAALLHDIGKIGIHDFILQKAGPLNEEEWQEVKGHPSRAVQILKGIPGIEEAIPIILHHHERYDGTGYPDGLRGDDIPLGARILAIADSYEAMISERAFRNANTPKEALLEIKNLAGSQFDPNLANLFISIMEQ